jgi:hypothetical protein
LADGEIKAGGQGEIKAGGQRNQSPLTALLKPADSTIKAR